MLKSLRVRLAYARLEKPTTTDEANRAAARVLGLRRQIGLQQQVERFWAWFDRKADS